VPYVRRGVGQCDPVLNPDACNLTPPIVSVGPVLGGSLAYTGVQTQPYVAPTGTSPIDTTLATLESGLSANLGTYLLWAALGVGLIVALKAVG